MADYAVRVMIVTLLISGGVSWSCREEMTTTSTDSVPEWAKQVVWYQIFPERFRNGDPSNDPTVADITGSWPHGTGPYDISSWTADWYALQDWEGDTHDFYYHVQRRRYGGDLQGVLEKLDYLQELGVTALYFNPLFESPSLHKYDAATYHHIDDNFGPNPQKDRKVVSSETADDPTTWRWTTADSLFLQLIADCHERDIRVIIDGVFNHVGLNFWAFQDVRKKQQESKYSSWFTIKNWDDPETPENEFDYEGWAGVRELPEIREDENGPVPGMRDYIFASVRRWMDPNGDGDPSEGIDGWRLDVAELVSRSFWRDFRKVVRDINPEAYLVGEVWWEDWRNNEMFDASPWLQGDIFDAVMNYRWTREVIHFFVDEKNKISASEFDRRLAGLRQDYPQDVNYVLMNLLDSHDTDRIASQIVNPDDDFDHRDNPRDNPNYAVRKPTPGERQIQKLIVLFQMTYVGAPTVYYGDEAGMWGADDPDCRKPMVWPEMEFQPESTHPLGKERPADTVQFNEDLFRYYKNLIAIRTENPALQTGNFATLLTDDERDLFVFKRFDDNASLVIALNNSEIPADISVSVKEFDSMNETTDLVTGQVFAPTGSVFNLTIPAKSGLILN